MTDGPIRPVLVLGSSGNIGSSICDCFEAKGHEVVRATRVDFDLTDPQSIERYFSKLRSPVGIVVHAAGYNVPKLFENLTDQEVRACFESNVSGFLQVVRHLRGELVSARGRIVVLSSIFGFLSRSGRLPYSMSKHALLGVVKSLAIELGPYDVLVNSVSPGYIDTELTRRNNPPAVIDQLLTRIPLRRLGDVDTIAELVYFLSSDVNRYITGADVVVDGGFSIDGGP